MTDRMKAGLLIALVGLAFVFGCKATEEGFRGRAGAVIDGDTVEVLQAGKACRVRLAGIDCPEKGQPFGMKAKQFTSDLAFDKEVRVLDQGKDRYGRTVGEVILPDGRSLNRELVRAGLAWWYWQYSKDESMGALEAEAKAAALGLWADKNPVPPWEWRKKGRPE